ncbi:putative porin [Termitidicoccus mucosus]
MTSFRLLKKRLALLSLGALVVGAASTAPSVRAQDSGALLNVLVRKGILSDQEAENVRAELQHEALETSAGKWNLSSALNELKLSGDARARYEYRSGENGSTGDRQERNRFRYRFRLGLSGKLGDGWFFGTRLETGSGNRSTNVTAGDYSLSPFGKGGNNGIYLGQAYIGRTMGDFTFTVGRMANPLITSPMIWDDDINVEGLAEQWAHTSGNITYFVNLEQLVYDGVGTYNAFGSSSARSNTFLFGNQVGARLKLSGGATIQIAPTYYFYSNDGVGLTALTTPNNAIHRPVGVSVLDLPVEYSTTVRGFPLKIWGEFAMNLDADDRADAAGIPTADGEDIALQIGAALGATKVKGDWELRAFYQDVAAFALDTNLVDSDLFDSRTNMKGFGLAATYVLADGISVKITYAAADRKKDNLATYGAGDIGTANLTKYQLFQTDISVKF